MLIPFLIKKLNPIVTELFIRDRKLNISIAFIAQSYFPVHKIPNKRELQHIAFNHSSDIDFKDFVNLYKNYCKTIFFFSFDATLALFLVIDATLLVIDATPLRFRNNLVERI